jgi:hypothetical protein
MCSGVPKGKAQTYALFEQRAAKAKSLDRSDALSELAVRYFTSRGPATAQDFAWWSGLAAIDVRAAIEGLKSNLAHTIVDGQTYYYRELPAIPEVTGNAHLLPNYDEYIVAYKDRRAIIDEQAAKGLDARGNILFNNNILVDGRVIGAWRRTFRARKVVVELHLLTKSASAYVPQIEMAARRYGDFVGLPVETVYSKRSYPHWQETLAPYEPTRRTYIAYRLI